MSEAAKRPSGIEVIDDHWEGLSAGAVYLYYGPTAAQRDLFLLASARAGLTSGRRIVILSRRHPRTLESRARLVGLDLRKAVSEEAVTLLRIPDRLYENVEDSVVEDSLQKVARLAERLEPARLVVEDFSPFVRMRSLARFRESCLRFLDQVTRSSTTTILGLGEPANLHSEEIVTFLRSQLEGLVHIEPEEEDEFARRLTLLPALGSLNAAVAVPFDVRRLSAAEVEPPAATDTSPGELVTTFGEDGAIRLLSNEKLRGDWHHRDPLKPTRKAEFPFERSHFLEGLPTGETIGAARRRRSATSVTDKRRASNNGPTESPESPRDDESATDRREAFAGLLNAAFDNFVVRGTHFSLVSIDADQLRDRGGYFQRVIGALGVIAILPDSVLVDRHGRRAAAVLSGRTIQSEHELLLALRRELGDGHQVEDILRSLDVVIRPTGHPYLSAADFLRDFDQQDINSAEAVI